MVHLDVQIETIALGYLMDKY